MKVLTYVGGILTIIDGAKYFSDTHTKPSFITGTTFYYEPTQSIMDGVALTTTAIADADAYIASFAYPTPVAPTVYNWIDADGNFIVSSEEDLSSKYTSVSTAPTNSTDKYFGGKWQPAALVDKTTNYYSGIGDTRGAPNTYYAVPPLTTLPFSINKYKYISGSWVISLEDAKADRIGSITKSAGGIASAIKGSTVLGEMTSWSTQLKEANAWNTDNTVSTPIIDGLIAGRAIVGETKQSLVTKILTNSANYQAAYAPVLGKAQGLLKKIATATTLAEIEAIVW